MTDMTKPNEMPDVKPLAERLALYIQGMSITDLETYRVQLLLEAQQALATKTALVEGLRRERNDLKESLELELKENLMLFDTLKLLTAEDFGHDTSTVAVRKKVVEIINQRNTLAAQNHVLREALASIQEYWNGANDSAPDACDYARGLAHETLSKTAPTNLIVIPLEKLKEMPCGCKKHHQVKNIDGMVIADNNRDALTAVIECDISAIKIETVIDEKCARCLLINEEEKDNPK